MTQRRLIATLREVDAAVVTRLLDIHLPDPIRNARWRQSETRNAACSQVGVQSSRTLRARYIFACSSRKGGAERRRDHIRSQLRRLFGRLDASMARSERLYAEARCRQPEERRILFCRKVARAGDQETGGR